MDSSLSGEGGGLEGQTLLYIHASRQLQGAPPWTSCLPFLPCFALRDIDLRHHSLPPGRRPIPLSPALNRFGEDSSDLYKENLYEGNGRRRRPRLEGSR